MTGRGGRLAAVALAGLVAVGLLVVATWGSPPDERAGGRPLPTPTQESPADQDGAGPPAATGRVLPSQWPEFVPTRLTLGAGAVAQVDPVSVVDGTLALPVDADRVGWWRDGSRAGAPFGTVVLAGHLDSDTDPAGYLAGLVGVARGDVVELSGGGERQTYKVTDNYLLPRADLSSRSDLFVQQRRHRLLLITCGGPYDVAAGRYPYNRVVIATPVLDGP